MPRRRRLRLAGVPQHVLQRGLDRRPIFRRASDFQFYLACLMKAADDWCCHVHAYVLMPDHVHLLATPHTQDGLSRMMQSIGTCYVPYFNHGNARHGALFEGRYRACLVEPSYLLACYRYVELNPVRGDLAQHAGDYPWSSYRHHAYGDRNRIVTDHAVYFGLGTSRAERQLAYRDLHRFGTRGQLLEEVRRSVQHERVLGSERFKDEIERRLCEPVRPGRRGRPPKAARAAGGGRPFTRASASS